MTKQKCRYYDLCWGGCSERLEGQFEVTEFVDISDPVIQIQWLCDTHLRKLQKDQDIIVRQMSEEVDK